MTAAMVCGRSSGDLARSNPKRGIEGCRDVAPGCTERRNRPFAVAEQPLHEGLAAVRGLAGQEIVQRAPERVNVGTAVGHPWVIGLLGRHVVDRTHDRAADRQVELGSTAAIEFLWLVHARQAEVENFDRARRIQQQICRLDVAMNDAVIMSFLQAAGCLDDAIDRLDDRQRALLLDGPGQIPARRRTP